MSGPSWWRDGAMVCEADGDLDDDQHFVADAATEDDAQRLVDWHNAARYRCRFLVRGEGTTPADIHECGRTRAEHPVIGHGRFENHKNYLAGVGA